MSRSRATIILILIAVVVALALRLPRLSLRTMHTDEAVHADKFASLIESNSYIYDRNEYHGPTLNYFTLIPALLTGQTTYSQLTEPVLRIVPVIFSIVLILLFIPLRNVLTAPVAVIAAFLTAVSPAMTFYSRYYIQEILLVTFTFAAIVSAARYFRTNKPVYAILTGLSLGLMHATKETCAIAFFSLAAALVLTILLDKKDALAAAKKIKLSHIILAIASAAIVSMLFFSSFFTNPKGIADSVLTFTDYLHRASETPAHTHPWHYYLSTLLYFKLGYAPIFTEAVIVILSAVGFLIAVIKPRTISANPYFIRFIAFYTLIMTALYSFISYKTPWCMLGFLATMIILAAFAVVAIFKIIRSVPAKSVFAIIVAIASAHLVYQSCLANFQYPDSPANPYVYGHSTSDVPKIAARIITLASYHELGSKMPIEIIAPDHDYWPFPWYLRTHNRKSIGYFTEVEDAIAPAPVIITFPRFIGDLLHKLYELPPPGQKNLYVDMFTEPTFIRPYVEIVTYVRRDLSERADRQLMPVIPDMPKGNQQK